jgi:hypothetical protein
MHLYHTVHDKYPAIADVDRFVEKYRREEVDVTYRGSDSVGTWFSPPTASATFATPTIDRQRIALVAQRALNDSVERSRGFKSSHAKTMGLEPTTPCLQSTPGAS